MTHHKYILVDRKPVPEPDTIKWAQWFENFDNRRLYVSTVFLGLDHNWEGEGRPILFETMVFRNKSGEEADRYCTWEEAEAGHERMVQKVLKEKT